MYPPPYMNPPPPHILQSQCPNKRPLLSPCTLTFEKDCLQIGPDQVHGYAPNRQMRDGGIGGVLVDQEEGELEDAHGDAQAECPVEVFFSPHVPRQREPHLKIRV